jgi:hypothetical protein
MNPWMIIVYVAIVALGVLGFVALKALVLAH